jgi:hypothetical protein
LPGRRFQYVLQSCGQVHTQRQQQQWTQECVGGSHIPGNRAKAVPGAIAAHAATSTHGHIQLLPTLHATMALLTTHTLLLPVLVLVLVLVL